MDSEFEDLKNDLEKILQNKISELEMDTESKEYLACTFNINKTKIVFRRAKTTPKKVGQFVTLWKRNPLGKTEPYSIQDKYTKYMIYVKNKKKVGCFIFPKEVLFKHGVLCDLTKTGKLGFRVYPPWDKPTNKQALATAKWQREWFHRFDAS